MLRFLAGVVAWLVLAQTACAEAPYMDDRSTAASVVRSLYNAINRHEFARAYDYFSVPPAKNYDDYVKGFEATAHVDVLLGDVSGDSGAGSTFFSVPTAIKSTGINGKIDYFAGCYTLRQVNGSIQDTPFNPLHIEKGALKPIKKDDFVSYSLPKCGQSVIETEQKVIIETAKAMFAAEQAGKCAKVNDTLAGENEPAVYSLNYRGEGSDQDSVTTLYMFSCSLYAYNESWVFYAGDPVEGLHILSFAEPNVVVSHPKGDDEGTKIESIAVKGFTATTLLINADFDEKTKTISSFNKWRGIADASSNGAWTFNQGQFILQDYDVDPTYNSEIDPINIMKDGKVQKLP
jgi:Protein of unknown function (DUF1176)